MPLIRTADECDAELLPDIERCAGESFRAVRGLEWLADAPDRAVGSYRNWIAAGTTWVALDAAGEIAGFLSAEVHDGELHIWELAVRQELQRRGYGSALLASAIGHARARGLAALTLTTFREVAWNEPYYRRHGFRTLDPADAGERLIALLRSEPEQGLPAERRCAMRLRLE